MAVTSSPLQRSDFEALSRLLATCFDVEEPEALVWFDHWWTSNPNWNPAIPMGWVLRDESINIIGFTANIPFRYVIGRQPGLCFVTGTTAVHPEWRGKGVSKLVGRLFAEQTGVELLVGVDSIPAALRMWKSVGLQELELNWPGGARIIIADPAAFLQKGLSKFGLRFGSSKQLQDAAEEKDASRVQPVRSGNLRIERVWNFREEDEQNLLKCRASNASTFPYRDVRELNWLYGRHLPSRKAMVLTARRGEELVGFAAFKNNLEHYFLLECRCRDLEVQTAWELLRAARNIARTEKKSHLVIWPYTTMVRAAMGRGIPLRKKPMSYCYRSNTDRLDINDWERSPGDGDISVI
jgi:GNAT superfamily N-acetyltransferase